MMDYDLNLVRVFEAVARSATLTAAAKELRLPVSSVTRSMSKLERQLGAQLVRRSPRGILLTELGSEYQKSCTHVLRRLKMASEAILDQRNSPRGTLRVMCPVMTAHSVLLPVLPEFLKAYPDLRVELRTYASDWDQEPKESVDVFFKVKEPNSSGRRCRIFPGTRIGLFASTAFVQSQGKPLDPGELVNFPCIGIEPWKLTRGKDTVQIMPSYRVMAEDPIIFQGIVLSGMVIGPLPMVMAYQPEVRKKLVPILPGWELKPVTHCALYFGPARLTPKVEVFLSFVEKFLGTELDPRLKSVSYSEGVFTTIQRKAG